MQLYKKIFLILAIVLVAASSCGFIAGKIYIGKILKDVETRKEIASIIAFSLDGVLTDPRVVINSVALKGFSTFRVNGVQVFDGKKMVFSAPANTLHCSIFAQLLLGSCNAELKINLGIDGDITLAMSIPRSVLFASDDYVYNISGSGQIERFNIYKLLSQKTSSSNTPLKLRSATVDGNIKFSLTGQGEPRLVVDFDGKLSKVLLEINVRGKREEQLSLPELSFRIDQDRLKFIKPVRVKVLGATLLYTGGLSFKSQLSWQGALQVSSAGLFSKMVPTFFNCKSKPTNPLNFKIVGLVGAPSCR